MFFLLVFFFFKGKKERKAPVVSFLTESESTVVAHSERREEMQLVYLTVVPRYINLPLITLGTATERRKGEP